MAGRNRKTPPRPSGKERTKRSALSRIGLVFEHFSQAATRFAGSSWAFSIALGVIVLWALSGPIFGFSDTWQLVVNTSTTIVTFLMVFLIQRSQNKETTALELKLNELVAAMQGASNRLIDAEDLSEHELEALHRYYAQLARMAKQSEDITESHSVEEARERHGLKSRHGLEARRGRRRPKRSAPGAAGGAG